MLEKVTKKLAEKMGRGVKEAAEPIRTEVRKTVDLKVDLYSRILRLGVLIFLFIDGTKRVQQYVNEPSVSPNHIVINNYITKKDGEDS